MKIMFLMTAALLVGLLLSILVVLDALRPRQANNRFAAPRRRQATRLADTLSLDSMTLNAR